MNSRRYRFLLFIRFRILATGFKFLMATVKSLGQFNVSCSNLKLPETILVLHMEWLVLEKAQSSDESQQMLKVRAEGKLTFIVWVKSNRGIQVGYMLTPVIDGYIANHNKAHFVTILKAKEFCLSEWRALTILSNPLDNISKTRNIISSE